MSLILIKHQRPDIDRLYLYIKDPLKSKYQLLINGREKAGIENLKNPKAFIDYSRTIDDVYENLEDYDPTKEERRVLMVFDYMIADVKSNKKLSPIEEVHKRNKNFYLFCFNITILFQSA